MEPTKFMETKTDKLHITGALEQFELWTDKLVEASRTINIADGKRAAFEWTGVSTKWLAAGGVLAVRAIEEYSAGAERHRLAAEANERSMKRLTHVIAWATAIYAASTLAFYIYQWRHPPIVTFAPTIQAAPTPSVTVQAPPAAAPPVVNVYIGGKKARAEKKP